LTWCSSGGDGDGDGDGDNVVIVVFLEMLILKLSTTLLASGGLEIHEEESYKFFFPPLCYQVELACFCFGGRRESFLFYRLSVCLCVAFGQPPSIT